MTSLLKGSTLGLKWPFLWAASWHLNKKKSPVCKVWLAKFEEKINACPCMSKYMWCCRSSHYSVICQYCITTTVLIASRFRNYNWLIWRSIPCHCLQHSMVQHCSALYSSQHSIVQHKSKLMLAGSWKINACPWYAQIYCTCTCSSHCSVICQYCIILMQIWWLLISINWISSRNGRHLKNL